MKRAAWSVMLGVSCALLGACSKEDGTEDPVEVPSMPDAGPTRYGIWVHIPLAMDPCEAVTATAWMPYESIGPVPLVVGNGAIEGVISDVPVYRQHPVYVTAYNSAGLGVYSGNGSIDVEASGREEIANLFTFSSPEDCPAAGPEGILIYGSLRSGPMP